MPCGVRRQAPHTPTRRGLCMLSLKSLGVSKDVVTCWKIADAPEQIQEIDLTGTAKFAWVVPTKCLEHVQVNSIHSERIRGGIVFVS